MIDDEKKIESIVNIPDRLLYLIVRDDQMRLKGRFYFRFEYREFFVRNEIQLKI